MCGLHVHVTAKLVACYIVTAVTVVSIEVWQFSSNRHIIELTTQNLFPVADEAKVN